MINSNIPLYIKHFAAIVLLLLSSCSNEIQMPDTAPQGISISGYICSEKSYILVRIYNIGSSNYYPEKVNNAVVELHGNDTVYSFSYDSQNYIYKSNLKIKGEIGQAYTLKVIHNNIEYCATDTMPPLPSEVFNLPTRLSSSHYEFNFHNFGFTETNEWACRRGDEPISFSNIFNGYKGFPFSITHKGSIPHGSFSIEGSGYGIGISDTLNFYKASISTAYEKHIRDLYSESDWKGNIFSVQPDNIYTNFNNGAYGFFAAKSITAIEVLKEDLIIIEEQNWAE